MESLYSKQFRSTCERIQEWHQSNIDSCSYISTNVIYLNLWIKVTVQENILDPYAVVGNVFGHMPHHISSLHNHIGANAIHAYVYVIIVCMHMLFQ